MQSRSQTQVYRVTWYISLIQNVSSEPHTRPPSCRMDLVIVHNDPMNTYLASNSGVQFKVTTPTDRPTTVVRVESITSIGRADTLIGHLELCPTRDLRLQLCDVGSELTLHPITGTDLDKYAAISR